MASETVRSIRFRMRSVKNAQKMARAMFLSASAKSAKTQKQMEESRRFQRMAEEMLQILLPYWKASANADTVCRIVVAGDRGMSGGYNGKILSAAASEDRLYLPIGKKAALTFGNKLCEKTLSSEKTSYCEILRQMEMLVQMAQNGEIRRAEIISTAFSGEIIIKTLFSNQKSAPKNEMMIFEPDAEEMIQNVIAKLLAGVVYANVCEANAAEQRFRRIAMDAAQKNAGDMLDEMQKKLNRIRQAKVTQEMIELVENGGE